MTTLQLLNADLNNERTVENSGAEKFLDIETIRRRVAKIRNTWSAETAKSRAVEGMRRRAELLAMFDEMTDDREPETTFSLVG